VMLAARCGCTKEVPMLDRQFHRCDDHGDVFVHASKLKPRKQMQRGEQSVKPRKALKRTQRRETSAEKKARLHFNWVVKSRKCWFAWHRLCELCEGEGQVAKNFGIHSPGRPEIMECPACGGDGKHHCTKPKDAHHLVPQRFTRKMFKAVLPEDQFVAILHNPLIGAPLCRKAHDAIEAKQDRIYFEDLTPECIEYIGTLPDFVLIELERQCPKRAQLDPPSTTRGLVPAPETEQ
jgi:hypothetical protein